MRICIITDRLPQPERQRGCILEIDEERGLSLIEQGFAKALDDAEPAKPAEPAEPEAPAAAPAPRRLRTSAR
jgi:hypothetical protein